MPALKSLIGQRFTRLVVLEKSPSKNNFAYWKVQCDCGTIKDVMGMALVKKNTRSCGCLKLEKLRQPWGNRGHYHGIFGRLQRMASNDGREMSITYEDYIEFTKIDRCYYCKALLYWVERYVKGKSFGYNLDRKNNDIGYTVDNCVPCCKRCNRGRTNLFTHDEWYRMTTCFREDYEREQLNK